MKINNMAKAKMKREEQKLNPVPKKQSKRSAPTNEIKSKKIKLILITHRVHLMY